MVRSTRDESQCDGWVDNLEPTLLIIFIYSLIQGHNLNKTINYLPTRHNCLFRSEKELPGTNLFPNSGRRKVNIFVIVCTYYSPLLLIIYQYSSIAFLSLICRRGSAAWFFVDNNSKQFWSTNNHSRTIRYKYMTSVSGGTYAGQYQCDGWVDNLEPTLFIILSYFLI